MALDELKEATPFLVSGTVTILGAIVTGWLLADFRKEVGGKNLATTLMEPLQDRFARDIDVTLSVTSGASYLGSFVLTRDDFGALNSVVILVVVAILFGICFGVHAIPVSRYTQWTKLGITPATAFFLLVNIFGTVVTFCVTKFS